MFCLLFFLLYKQLYVDIDFRKALVEFWQNTSNNSYLILLVVVLMLLNWSLETMKWKFLIDRFHYISWNDAVKGILFGVTFSMFTPSRVGEFGGRVMALQTDRLQAIVSTLIGSMAQMVVNLSIGSLAVLGYLMITHQLDYYLLIAVGAIVLILIIGVHFCYYNLDIVNRLVNNHSYFTKIKRYIDNILLYSSPDFCRIEIYSFLRYCIYSLQYFLLLHYFSIPLSPTQAILLIPTIFFIQTVNPFNIALLDFGFRGNVALFFLSEHCNNPIQIIATTTLLWFINLIIPAVLGSIAALKFNFVDEKEERN